MRSTRRLPGLLFTLALGTALALPGDTFTVVNTDDSGAGSLRQAILDANANPGADTIEFAIPGPPPHTITLATLILPASTGPVTIDATTQPGYAGSPIVVLDMNDINNNGGLRLSGGSSTVRGLVLNHYVNGIVMDTNGGNVIAGNYIGTDVTGTQDGGGNEGTGVLINSGSGNLIGGSDPSARNVISGNGGNAIRIVSGGNVIAGNFIGTDVTGTVALPNHQGISLVSASNTVVGGMNPGEGNLISGSATEAIAITLSDSVSILGNLIGTDVTGTLPIPNSGTGVVSANNNVTNLVVGAPGAGNVISGNSGSGTPSAIYLISGVSGSVIQGNLVGTDVTGTLPLGNTFGIQVSQATDADNLIGGTGPGEGNIIAFNQGFLGFSAGIWNKGVRNTIRGNSIHDNFGLGIDNAPLAGPTPNDPGDGDSGPNENQNFPIIVSVMPAAPVGSGIGSTRIQGVLHSAPSTTYDLDFYANDPCAARPQDFLEGTTYLGSGQITTDGNGDGPFDVTLPVSIADGAPVTATATDPDGNTSEFSQRLPFSVLPRSGPDAGGSPITISGTDFAAGATVTIGGQPATGVNVTNDTTITAMTPALPAGTANDLVVTNTDATAGTLVRGWIADFLDVPPAQQFHAYVTTLVSNAITSGIGGGLYGVNDSTLRQQMAVFLLKARYGICYVPPQCAGIFSDVPCPSIFADWIEDLAGQGITGGCGTGVYCPQNPVRRDQMAVFLLKTRYGSSYTPPMCSGTFADVPCPSQFADWIEELAAEMITSGCGGGNYCPLNPNTRGQMAVFIVKTFSLE